MKNRKALAGLGALVLVLALMAGLWLEFRPETQAGGKEFNVTVTHSDGTRAQFRYETQAEYLGDALLEEGLIEGQDGPYGLMISAVDGQTADWNVDQSYWALYIDGAYAVTGVDTTPVTQGAEYELAYTRG